MWSPAAKQYVVEALRPYWLKDAAALSALPMSDSWGERHPRHLVPRLVPIELPEWARDLGDEGLIAVPACALNAGGSEPWVRVNWLGAAFWYLHGVAERAWEREHGPIHSYSFRLRRWPAQMWERAWVNRIALFLRRWEAHRRGTPETELFGAAPAPRILVTHDLDAVHKTMAIRLKQCAFHGFNALRSLARGEVARAASTVTRGLRFMLGPGDYRQLHTMASMEADRGIHPHLMVYGGRPGWKRSPQQLLLDPAYDVADPVVRGELMRVAANGWQVGVHPSFHAWRDPDLMRGQKNRVERALDRRVTTCRQHWLRFSWEHTWEAQQAAGFELDMTLGFNDRPGFRNGAALEFHPFDDKTDRAMRLRALPTLLMDSHLYDYHPMDDGERAAAMRRWMDEVRFVGGTACVIWHPHTLADDYGWMPGFRTLLHLLADADRL